MNKIFSSASKLVLLYIILILGLLALVAGIFSVITGSFTEASKVILGAFGVALNFVLGFYFGYKGDTPVGTGTITKTEVSKVDEASSFAGK